LIPSTAVGFVGVTWMLVTFFATTVKVVEADIPP
jgi:hypothetical protein